MARLFVRPMVGQLKAFRRLGRHFFFFLLFPLAHPSLSPSSSSVLDPLLLRLRKSRDPWDWRGPFRVHHRWSWSSSCLGVEMRRRFVRALNTIRRWYFARWIIERWSARGEKIYREDSPNFECNLYILRWRFIFWFWRRSKIFCVWQ